MKKKILSVLLISALVLSMASCGASTETPENTTEGTKATTTTAAEEDVAETTTTTAEEDATEATTTAAVEEDTAETTTTAPETEETATTTEAPKEVQKITSEPILYGDCLVFEESDMCYVYNTTDNKMYEYEYNDTYEIKRAHGKLASTLNVLYNIETGEFTNVQPYTEYLDDYNPVCSFVKGFDGDVFSFGVIDKNGEWVVPLSSEYEICKNELAQQFIKFGDIMYCGGSYYLIYDWKNDKILDTGKTKIDGKSIHNAILSVEGLILVTKENSGKYNYYKYDFETEATALLYENRDYQYGNTVMGCIWLSDEENNHSIVFDENLNIIQEYDYYSLNVLDATENYVIFIGKGADSGEYTIILDKNGNRVIEPISGRARTFCKIIGDYAVIDDKIINCKTGETKTVDYEEISGFTGKMLMQSDGAYYLADVSDPETLINPFEIVE